MNEKFALIRLPVVLLVIFFLGKLLVGALGGSYELGTRMFAMVPLTVHLCLVWGALSRTYQGYGAGAAATTGVLIALVAQILIFGGTMLSYLVGADTHFNNPIAMVGEDRMVGMGEAFVTRGVGIIVNSIIGAISALIGWALGRLLPSRA